MINITDNFLPQEVFNRLQQYCNENEFQIVDAGEKQFSVLSVPEDLLNFFKFDGLELCFSFIRSAYNGFDEDIRIHADNIIQGNKTNYACVLYINNAEGVTENGTAFYKHKELGYKLPDDCTNEEFDRLILEDANDESKWEKLDYISSRPNRLLMYD